MIKDKKTKTRWGLAGTIIALAWPTMIEELMQTAVQYIDTAMVGTLGTDAVAAVGSTATINWLILTTLSALGVGFLSFISRSFGAGQDEIARKASAQAVFAVLVSGVAFTILTTTLSPFVPVWMQVDERLCDMASRYFLILYAPMIPRAAIIIFGTVLRSAGDSKTPMRVGVLVNLINVILNFLLIYPTRAVSLFSVKLTLFGAGMGIEGAALASAAAFTVGGICMTVLIYRHPKISPKGYSIKPDVSILSPCMKVAVPNMCQRFTTSFGYVAFASMINSLGELSMAAHTIANTVESAFYIPGYGMQAAAATLAGNALGAKDRKGLKKLARLMIIIEAALMVVSGALLFAFAPDMMGLFSKDTKVIRLGAIVLRMVAVSEPFYGISIIIEGMLQGMGKTMVPFVFNIFGMWGIRILGTFICIEFFGLGLVAAWACMILHNLMLFCSFLIYWFKGKWSRQMWSKTASEV